MYEHFFAGGMMMLPEIAVFMAQALQSKDPTALNRVRSGPVTLHVEGQRVILNGHLPHPGINPTAALIDGGARYGGGYSVVNGIAIVPICGPMIKNGAQDGFFCQAEGRATIRAATLDRSVSGILLYLNTPGGSVNGTRELAAEVRAASSVKSVVAWIDGTCASAGLWVASAAPIIYASETSMVGSIGVTTRLIDASVGLEKAGIRVVNVQTGKFKNVGDPGQPLTADGQSYIQGLIDKLFGMFIEDVSEWRGLSEGAIRGMEAKVYVASDAKRAGLISGVLSNFDLAWDLMRRSSDKNYKSHVTRNSLWRARLGLEEMES